MLVSDHNSYDGYREWKKSIKGKQHQDFVVLKGVEYDTRDCGHILVIMPEGVKLWILEMRGLPVARLIRIGTFYGGILGPAHPFGEKYMSAMTTQERKEKYARKLGALIEQFDFIEIFNACEKRKLMIRHMNSHRNTTSPDSEAVMPTSRIVSVKAYTELPDSIRSESDLIAYIKTNPRIECGGSFTSEQQKTVWEGLMQFWWNPFMFIIRWGMPYGAGRGSGN